MSNDTGIAKELQKANTRRFIDIIEYEEGINLNPFQREIFEKLDDSQEKISIIHPQRGSGKTFLCRLLLKYEPLISILVPSESYRSLYPREYRNKIYVIREGSDITGIRFSRVIFDESSYNEAIIRHLSYWCDKAILFISNSDRFMNDRTWLFDPIPKEKSSNEGWDE